MVEVPSCVCTRTETGSRGWNLPARHSRQSAASWGFPSPLLYVGSSWHQFQDGKGQDTAPRIGEAQMGKGEAHSLQSAESQEVKTRPASRAD